MTQAIINGVLRDLTPEEEEAEFEASQDSNDLVPQTVSALQARIALAQAGLLDAVATHIDQSDEVTKLAWEYAVEWRRHSPMIAGIAGALNLTEEQVDDLFREAAQVEL